MTADFSQGKEYDTVILATVTPGGNKYGLGFVLDVQRLNVALTRAKQGLSILARVVIAMAMVLKVDMNGKLNKHFAKCSLN